MRDGPGSAGSLGSPAKAAGSVCRDAGDSEEGDLEVYVLDGEGETRDVELWAGGKVVAEQVGVEGGGHEDNAEIRAPVDGPDSSNDELHSAVNQANQAGTSPAWKAAGEDDAREPCLGRRSLKMMRRKSSFMPLDHGTVVVVNRSTLSIVTPAGTEMEAHSPGASGSSRIGEAETDERLGVWGGLSKQRPQPLMDLVHNDVTDTCGGDGERRRKGR